MIPDTPSVRHWRGDIYQFSSQARRRYAPSMRQRIDLDQLWRTAKKEMLLNSEGAQEQVIACLPGKAPYALDELLAEDIDGFDLVKRLQP